MNKEAPTKKSLGQHWLNDAPSLESIVRTADVKSGDKILEIGPGTGTLTAALVQHGAQVVALEFDESLISNLNRKFAGQPVELIHGDIRTFNLAQLPKNYKIVANIPYYLTANLLRLLTDTTNKPAIAVLLVQKEVASRVAEPPGRMSFISAAVQLNFRVSLGSVVKAELFTPPPKVDSQILILERLPEPYFSDTDYSSLIKFMKIGFTQPRKTLINNLHVQIGPKRAQVEKFLAENNLKPTARPQELTLKNWHDLSKLI